MSTDEATRDERSRATTIGLILSVL